MTLLDNLEIGQQTRIKEAIRDSRLDEIKKSLENKVFWNVLELSKQILDEDPSARGQVLEAFGEMSDIFELVFPSEENPDLEKQRQLLTKIRENHTAAIGAIARVLGKERMDLLEK